MNWNKTKRIEYISPAYDGSNVYPYLVIASGSCNMMGFETIVVYLVWSWKGLKIKSI